MFCEEISSSPDKKISLPDLIQLVRTGAPPWGWLFELAIVGEPGVLAPGIGYLSSPTGMSIIHLFSRSIKNESFPSSNIKHSNTIKVYGELHHQSDKQSQPTIKSVMEGSNLENTIILKVVKLPFLTSLFHLHKFMDAIGNWQGLICLWDWSLPLEILFGVRMITYIAAFTIFQS